ncbi:MAG: Xaa-Pro peptidase family protein [Pseudomonadota bacterium]
MTTLDAAAAALRNEAPIDEAAIFRHRRQRLLDLQMAADVAASVSFDPVNIRYATNTRNMQVWTMHNFCRYAFLATSGECVMFEVGSAQHLAAHNPLVDEVRPGWSADYLVAAERGPEMARNWARELAALVHLHGGGNRRLAVDRLDVALAAALQSEGLELVDAKGIFERARSIKSMEEIRALKRSLATCDEAVMLLREWVAPGMRECDALAFLIAESIKRGGEYPETRLMTSGPRTNPWFQETGDRRLENGDLLAFDTDLIGPMGFYNDISRTWIVGDAKPNDIQKRLYAESRAQLEHNVSMLRPGVALLEYAERAYRLEEQYLKNRYADVGHGCGLGVEYPFLWYPEDAEFGAYDGMFEENMVVCIESYVGAEGGDQGVKLEQPAWITAEGPLLLSDVPLEDVFN